jgi:predicted membrane channel-forming protein YqfA (hemolysin III family)
MAGHIVLMIARMVVALVLYAICMYLVSDDPWKMKVVTISFLAIYFLVLIIETTYHYISAKKK